MNDLLFVCDLLWRHSSFFREGRIGGSRKKLNLLSILHINTLFFFRKEKLVVQKETNIQDTNSVAQYDEGIERILPGQVVNASL